MSNQELIYLGLGANGLDLYSEWLLPNGQTKRLYLNDLDYHKRVDELQKQFASLIKEGKKK